ncbi:TLR4 protein, partial [Atractosteus spatula]|nr:TLR4 protein [Atractosteus spatula]
MALNLSRIPDEIPVTVRGLDFSFNYLKILQQASITLLPDLTALDHTSTIHLIVSLFLYVLQYKCKITLIEDNAFLHVKQLTILIFTGNPIKQISERPFSHLKILQQLTFVEVCIFPIWDLLIFSLTELKELNMGKNNPKTIRTLNYINLIPLNTLNTLNFTALTLLDFCNHNISSVLFIFLTIVAYKYQYYFHYGCILLNAYRSTQQGESEYDAFVIYFSGDETWVFEELVSKHFMESKWCKFEFEVAQSLQLLEGTPGIIAVILKDVDEERITIVLGLHKYLKRNTCLKWKDNPLGRMRFWTRLRRAILSGRT